MIEIAPEHYDALIKKRAISSTEYALLKIGVIAFDQTDGIEQRKIRILCEETSAAALNHALRVRPEAASAIVAGTNYAPQS